MKKIIALVLILNTLSLYSQDVITLPPEAIDYFTSAMEKVKSENWSEAIEGFSKVIELSPSNYKAYYNRGLCYDELTNYEKALQDYDMFIKLNPEDHDMVYYKRGFIKMLLKDDNSALADFNKSIELNPNNSKYYIWRSIVKTLLKDTLGACEDLAKSISLGNEAAKSLAAFCLDYLNTGKKIEYINELKIGAYSYPNPSMANIMKWLDLTTMEWEAEMKNFEFRERGINKGCVYYSSGRLRNSVEDGIFGIDKCPGNLMTVSWTDFSGKGITKLDALINELEPYYTEFREDFAIYDFKNSDFTYQFIVSRNNLTEIVRVERYNLQK